MESEPHFFGGASHFFWLLIIISLPNDCLAYVTWGDFHVFAVIFFSFLGGFLGLGAIFGAIYFACGKPFLDRHQREVAQTHREHHPWPPGSARWRLQQMIKSERRSGETKFPIKKNESQFGQFAPNDFGNQQACASSYVPHGSFYQRALDYCGAAGVGAYAGGRGAALDREPIIGSSIDQYPPSASFTSIHPGLERPTYFTPSVEKNLPPLREEFEEYRIVREESFVSSTGGQGRVAQNSANELPLAQQQQQQTQHQQQSGQQQRADGSSIAMASEGEGSGGGGGAQLVRATHTTHTTTTTASRHRSPAGRHAPYTYI